MTPGPFDPDRLLLHDSFAVSGLDAEDLMYRVAGTEGTKQTKSSRQHTSLNSYSHIETSEVNDENE